MSIDVCSWEFWVGLGIGMALYRAAKAFGGGFLEEWREFRKAQNSGHWT